MTDTNDLMSDVRCGVGMGLWPGVGEAVPESLRVRIDNLECKRSALTTSCGQCVVHSA